MITQRSALKNDRKRLELRERTGMAISIDSDDENDWVSCDASFCAQATSSSGQRGHPEEGLG